MMIQQEGEQFLGFGGPPAEIPDRNTSPFELDGIEAADQQRVRLVRVKLVDLPAPDSLEGPAQPFPGDRLEQIILRADLEGFQREAVMGGDEYNG